MRIGRPFKGDVDNPAGNEGDVPEKRAIFRCLKKYLSQKRHEKKLSVLLKSKLEPLPYHLAEETKATI